MEYEHVVALIDKGFNEIKNEHLQPIKEQVLLTNGKIAELKTWKERINGGIAVIAFMGFTGLMAWAAYLFKTL